MTRQEERRILSDLVLIKQQVRENNYLLRSICEAINIYLANHNRENEEDFGRNILANMISNALELKSIKR